MAITYSKLIRHQIVHRDRHLISTQSDGYIVVDDFVLDIWNRADGKTLSQLLAEFRADKSCPEMIRSALACLVQAGLLRREHESRSDVDQQSARRGATLVSIISVITKEKEVEWFGECLDSIAGQTYKNLETLVIDNAADFNLDAWISKQSCRVQLLSSRKRKSYGEAINQGVIQARGDLFIFLNPDTRLEPNTVAEWVAEIGDDPRAAAVASKLKFWHAPQFLNGLGNVVTDFSWGSDVAIGHLDLGQFDHWEKSPSACFAAALINRNAWEQVGPIDEGFPAYYEDSDWCYRARALGYEVRLAPKAVVYHVFGGWWRTTQERSDLSPAKLRNVVYGRLRFVTKIVGYPLLRRFLRNYIFEDCTNLLIYTVHLKFGFVKAYISGWLKFIGDLPKILGLRKQLQDERIVPDEILFGFREKIPTPLVWEGLPVLNSEAIRTHYLPFMTSEGAEMPPELEGYQFRPQVLIVSNDVVDIKMAGPGMRYFEMARALAEKMDVILAVPAASNLATEQFPIVQYWEDRPQSLQVLVENCDIAVISGYMVQKFPFLSSTDRRLVVDMHNPFMFENLFHHQDQTVQDQEVLNTQAVSITNQLAKIGDFYLCGNERQRDLWMGFLAANGRVNPETFGQDQSLRELIEVVGMGLPDNEPQKGPMLHGVDPNIPEDAQIVFWGGGIWDWLDALSLIEAWPEVIRGYPKARLVFTGTRHPNPRVPTHRAAEAAIGLAKDIGELDRSIFFVEWIPYEERGKALSEASIGVVLHPMHLETRYSIRTRILDYIWADLPILVTQGDVTSEWVQKYQLGKVVPPLDPRGISQAIIELLGTEKESFQPNFALLKENLKWANIVAPLEKYCLTGGHAPDWQMHRKQILAPVEIGLRRYYLRRAIEIYRTEGLRALLKRIWTRFQLRFSP